MPNLIHQAPRPQMQPRNMKPQRKPTETSTVAASIQSMSSSLSGAHNPIALVNWISSFLRTLEKANGVMDKIATVSITLCPVNSSMHIQCLDSSLRASRLGCPLSCFQGLAAAFHWSRNPIHRWQIIIEQAHLDASVCELLSKMNEVYTFLTTAELKAIESMKVIVGCITHQTLECSHFIRACCANRNSVS